MDVTTPAARVALRMETAAREFLSSLDSSQRQAAAWPFPSDQERRRWFYTPTDHGGLALGDMRPGLQRLALRLVAAGLSQPGFVTVSTIIGLENALDELEGWLNDFERERGRDPGRYYLRVFGEPRAETPWSWRFGGHHVSLHYLIVGGEVRSTTPSFLGADPAASPLLGGGQLRPLAASEDLARQLVKSLQGHQLKRAVVSGQAPIDLVGGNRARIWGGELPLHILEIWRGDFGPRTAELLNGIQAANEASAGLTAQDLEAVRITMEPKGIPASALTLAQKGILWSLLGVYLGRVPDELAELEAGNYAGDQLEQLWFLWAGGLEPGRPHYYRIQGPRLLIEYDNVQRSSNHIHSVWRNPQADFGDDILLSHHLQHH